MRISDRHLVQNIDNEQIVVIDQHTGEEVAMPMKTARRLQIALEELVPADGLHPAWAIVDETQEFNGVGYDEGTLRKVYEAVRAAGLGHQEVTDAISSLQNVGILFRERLRGAEEVSDA